MKVRYHSPARVDWHTELSADERARLERALLGAVRRAIESSAGGAAQTAITDFEAEANVGELFSSARYRPERGTYAVPSYDDGGEPREVPVEPSTARQAAGTSPPAARDTDWNAETIKAHLTRAFGTYAPRGQTHYGVQTPTGLVFADTRAGQTVLRTFSLHNYKKDVQGYWETTAPLGYPKGRFTFTVTGKAEGVGHPFPNVGIVTDLQGRQYGPPVYTPQEAGFKIVFDVPRAVQTGDAGQLGSPFRTGIMRRGSGQSPIFLRPSGDQDMSPLTEPNCAGASDDDYWNLFLNLCNARAIDNLEISEKYIREELVPRYVGPGGSPETLSDYSCQFEEKRQSAKVVTAAILKLVQQDPLLTQFIGGLKMSGDVPSAADREEIESKLADVPGVEEARQKILKKLNEILHSIARARRELCDDPERILDVPLVYQAVQEMVHGINPRFDQVVKERIHHKLSKVTWAKQSNARHHPPRTQP